MQPPDPNKLVNLRLWKKKYSEFCRKEIPKVKSAIKRTSKDDEEHWNLKEDLINLELHLQLLDALNSPLKMHTSAEDERSLIQNTKKKIQRTAYRETPKGGRKKRTYRARPKRQGSTRKL